MKIEINSDSFTPGQTIAITVGCTLLSATVTGVVTGLMNKKMKESLMAHQLEVQREQFRIQRDEFAKQIALYSAEAARASAAAAEQDVMKQFQQAFLEICRQNAENETPKKEAAA